MRWHTLLAVALLGLGSSACDKLPFVGKKEQATQPPAQPGAVAADTTPPAATPPPAPAPAPPPARVGSSADEEPWTPTQTGTVNPGMTRDDVVAVWGPPVVERQLGDWTYLYFRNGCERRCGTFDVVLLQQGAVVDAIVRGAGHVYSGVSSSPPDRAPAPTNVIEPPAGTTGAGS